MRKRVAVFGVGNVLIGDDAAGPSIIRWLENHYEFEGGVSVEDIGTPSLDLAARMGGYDAVIFVDAVSAKGEPGELRQYSRPEIVRNPPSIRMSPHDPSLKETILMVDLLPDGPDYITLIGIIPKSLDQFGLSEEVEEAIPAAAERVLDELRRLGVLFEKRTAPLLAAPFWSAAAELPLSL